MSVYTENAGFMSPYPPGLILPDVETRPSCVDMWAPVLVAAGSKPVGAWSIVARKDGTQQWAYDEHPLYTSNLDHAPGDVMGGMARQIRGETALRQPAVDSALVHSLVSPEYAAGKTDMRDVVSRMRAR